MTRLLSGIVLASAALAAIVWLPPPGLRILACVVATLAAYEYLCLVGGRWRALVPVVALCWAAGADAMPGSPVLLLVALIWVAVEVLLANHTVQEAAAGLFAALYIGLPLGLLVAVHERLGWQVTLLLIATVIVSDTAQYYAGRALGRRPLAPSISPGKTIEGALGGLVVGTAFLVLAGSRVLPAAGLAPLVLLGLLVVVSGMCGDLFESRLKRVAGVKDSSSLIPGHGGMLDRIDALLFAAIPFYLYVLDVRNVT